MEKKGKKICPYKAPKNFFSKKLTKEPWMTRCLKRTTSCPTVSQYDLLHINNKQPKLIFTKSQSEMQHKFNSFILTNMHLF